MPIPDFQTLMRPLLEAYSTGRERPISEVRHELAVQLALTEEELTERLPSGLATRSTIESDGPWCISTARAS